MTTANRRRRRTTAVAALAALAVSGCGDSSDAGQTNAAEPAASRTGSDARVLEFQSQLTSQSPAANGAAASPGAQMVLTGMLFKPGEADAVGRSQTACTRTAPGAGQVYQCQLSFVFRNGVIYGQSTASTQGPFEGVLTGGTHDYNDVLGTFAYKSTGDARVGLKLKLR